MAEEQGTIETNDHQQEIQDNSPNTLETGTLPETKESKEANKTISSTNKKSKKKNKPPKLQIESRNSNYSLNKYRKTSRTETNL